MHRLHPKFRINGIKSNFGVGEFIDLVSKCILLPVQLILLGDFNIHWIKLTYAAMVKLKDIIGSYNNTLFLMTTRDDDNVTSVVSYVISQYNLVNIELVVNKPSRLKQDSLSSYIYISYHRHESATNWHLTM